MFYLEESEQVDDSLNENSCFLNGLGCTASIEWGGLYGKENGYSC